MKERHGEATEVLSCLFRSGRSENSLFFLRFIVFFNMAKFLSIFAQVMMSEANGTNYDRYICYRP